jgi:hypothetical protein
VIKLKKLILVLISILCLVVNPEKSFAIHTKQYYNEEISKLDENSKEKIYQDLIICL